MSHTRLSAFARIRTATLVAILLMAVVARAQDVTSSALKAVFIYNFAKFTEWPADSIPATGALVMCVLGDAAVSEALVGAVKNRVLAGHPITVSLLTLVGPQPTCHVVYVSGIPGAQLRLFLAGLRDAPVLTISDIRGFAEFGGIVQIFFDNGNLRFSIQNSAAKRVRLSISAKLLQLGER